MTFTINTHTIVVGLCWVAGLGFAVVDVLLVPDWAALSTAFLILAATLTIRHRVDRYAESWTRAYKAGRDVEAQEVRKIR